MKQSKLESHIESATNIATGFVISYLVWMLIVGPLIDGGTFDPRAPHDAFVITSIFTVTSYIRSYFWRRFFNAGFHRWLHKVLANAHIR